MSKIQPTLSVDLDTAAAKSARSASNDNVAMGINSPLSGSVTFTVSSTGVVTPTSATAYPGDLINMENGSGASYAALCAYRNDACHCLELAGVSSGHMSTSTSYRITEDAANLVYTIKLPDASLVTLPATNAIKPKTSTGELHVGSGRGVVADPSKA